MRPLVLVLLLAVGCTAAPVSIPDPKPADPKSADPKSADSKPMTLGPFPELDVFIPAIMQIEAPVEMFKLREIRTPESTVPCELDALATDVDARTVIRSSSQKMQEVYDHRNCPISQWAWFSDEKGELTLTVDGTKGEWRRSMSSSFSRGVNRNHSSGEWVNPSSETQESQQRTSQEPGDEGRLAEEPIVNAKARNVTTYDHDDQGRVLAVWRDTGEGLKRIEVYTYGPFGVELVQFYDDNDRLSHERRHQYDDKGNLRVMISKSFGRDSTVPAYNREEYDENGSRMTSVTDQDGDGDTDSEWVEEYNDFGLIYRYERTVEDGIEYIVEWSGTYDSTGRLLRGQSIAKNNGRVERLELTLNQRDRAGNWREIALTRDEDGRSGHLGVVADERLLFGCNLKLEGETPTCTAIVTKVYDDKQHLIQTCTRGSWIDACERSVYGADGALVTDLDDKNDDGIAERRTESRYDANYTQKMLDYLTETRWKQIQQNPPTLPPTQTSGD